MKMHQLLVSLLLITHNIVLDCGPVCPQQCSLVEPCLRRWAHKTDTCQFQAALLIS